MKYEIRLLKEILLQDINTILNQLNECKNQLTRYNEIEGDYTFTAEILNSVYGNFDKDFTYSDILNYLINGELKHE